MQQAASNFSSRFQFLHRVLLAKNGERGAPRMERTLFAEGYHLFRERTNSFRLGQGRLDPLMLDQTANLIGHERLPVLSRPAELHRLLLVSHGIVPNE